ncbi:hypothetical protein [Myxococcus sp. AM010]|uniref:hypothetical protein n=1 Tax=Myxococcus sp. AM010 TaxID=2745138 RepID=UPI001595DF6B|nr:hypothetical protein [Myxococcus sp. AM010]NVJ14487.1 hypothetical protein [Myxococcus sp. AM010]
MGTRHGAREHPDIQGLIVCARKVAEVIGSPDVSDAELSRFIESILYGEKEAWVCAGMGLITREETANLLLAHLETWLMDRTNKGFPEQGAWDLEVFRPALEEALFG